LAEEARRRAAETGNHKAQFDGLITAGRALEALDRRDDALALYESAGELVETESGSPGRRREVYGAWADALASAGRHADAYAIAQAAPGWCTGRPTRSVSIGRCGSISTRMSARASARGRWVRTRRSSRR